MREGVRCGKQSCRCTQQKLLHGWYYYLYWREYGAGRNRILRKTYVKREAVESLKKQIKESKAEDKRQKLFLKEVVRLLQSG